MATPAEGDNVLGFERVAIGIHHDHSAADEIGAIVSDLDTYADHLVTSMRHKRSERLAGVPIASPRSAGLAAVGR